MRTIISQGHPRASYGYLTVDESAGCQRSHAQSGYSID